MRWCIVLWHNNRGWSRPSNQATTTFPVDSPLWEYYNQPGGNVGLKSHQSLSYFLILARCGDAWLKHINVKWKTGWSIISLISALGALEERDTPKLLCYDFKAFADQRYRKFQKFDKPVDTDSKLALLSYSLYWSDSRNLPNHHQLHNQHYWKCRFWKFIVRANKG